MVTILYDHLSHKIHHIYQAVTQAIYALPEYLFAISTVSVDFATSEQAKTVTFGDGFYNIVSATESDNLDLALMVSKIIGKPLNYKLVDPKVTRPRHDFRYSLSGEKMKNMGWKQKINLEQGLKQVIDWFLENERWL